MQNTEQKEIKQADAVTVMDNNQGRKFKALFLSNIVAIPGVNLTCDINNEKEARGIRDAFDNNEQIVVVASKSIVETPQIEDFLEFGCLCTIKRIMPQGSTVRVLLTGDARVKINKFEQGELFTVYGEIELDKNTTTPHAYQLMSEIKAGMRTLADGRALQGQLQAVMLDDEIEPALFSDLLVHFLAKEDLALQRELLVETDVEKRLEILNKQMTIVVTNFLTHKEIEEKVNDNIAKTQKEIYLREQLHVINEELNGEVDEIEEYTKKVKAIGLPKDSEEKVIKEINRLGKLPFGSPEIGYIRNFLDTVLELPWTKRTEVNIDINKAREVLNSEHYALDEVKQRILETLAVIKLTGKVNAQIICLVGPPGVGKTSIAKSVAKAMGREFVQVSLGGVSDESVIRGHRRTYVGAMCGRILAGMKQAGTINPVFLLDEIDKLSRDVRGDPSSALLEVLDPAQNDHFKDNFLELPYDLSQVMFIITANPETLMIAEDNNEFQKILLDEKTTIVPDGIGVLKGAKMLGIEMKETITGVELCVRLFEYLNEMKGTLCLFGAKKEVVEKLKKVLDDKYPNIKILKIYDGYIEDKDKVMEEIVDLKPDVTLLALGIPKQEMLIYKYLDKFNKGIFVGVGGSFDVLSGTKKRAPKIFLKLKLEWLYRITREPKRLKRFYKSNIKYLKKINELKKENRG